MSNYTDIQTLLHQSDTNANNGITYKQQRNSLKSGCPKCDSKKLPACICSKDSLSEDNEQENSTDLKAITSGLHYAHTGNAAIQDFSLAADAGIVELNLVLNCQNHQLQLTLKPGVSIIDIEKFLEKFIAKLASESNFDLSNENLNIEQLGEKLGVYYAYSEREGLFITIENKKHFTHFTNELVHQDVIVDSQALEQKMENLSSDDDHNSISPTPFSMTLVPY